MPKSSKKRKDKAADFSKAKLKLGKGKQRANNAVDTSFKCRSIVLPTQSIAVEKQQDTPTTKRKQTLSDLLSLLKHYGAGPRKDAILGLKELLETHPQLIDPSLPDVLSACVRLIVDEDALVRRTLHSFFAWLLPRILADDLIPHSPLLLLFTTSAQTHIFPEIRIDAIRFLDLWLEHIPQALTEGWCDGADSHGARVTEGYLGVLDAGTKFNNADGLVTATSTASVMLSPESKMVVLKSLSTFLQCALSSPGTLGPNTSTDSARPSIPTYYLIPSFTNVEAYENFDRVLQPLLTSTTSQVCRSWNEDADSNTHHEDFVDDYELLRDLGSSWSPEQLLHVASSYAGVDGSPSKSASAVTHLAHTLHATLVSAFLDSSPIVFSPGMVPPETQLQIVLSVAEIVRSLYNAILQGSSSGEHGSSREELQIILGYMAPYFPFKLDQFSNRGDIKLERASRDLNLIFCHLTSLLGLASCMGQSKPIHKKRRATDSHVPRMSLSKQTEEVSEYVIRLLRGETGISYLDRALTPQAYAGLLPTIWFLLNTGVHESSTQVLLAVIGHSIKTSSNAALKPATIEFVARIVLLDTDSQYNGYVRAGKRSDEAEKLEEWIGHLPKTLWELNTTHLSTTETILRFLLRLFQRKCSLLHGDLEKHMRLSLVPYFHITHSTRGQSPGPFRKLPLASLRRLALDVVATLSSGRHGISDLDVAVQRAVGGTDYQAYWDRVRKCL